MKRWINVFYLLLLFGVIFATNRIDKEHFETAQHSLNSIYEDRVIAQDLIYQLSSTFNDRHLYYINDTTVQLSSPNFDNQNAHIEELLIKYDKTSLTDKEKVELEQLKKNFYSLLSFEKSFEGKSKVPLEEVKKKFHIINENLDKLSAIQLSESKNLKFLGRKSLDNYNLIFIAEVIILVLVAALILVIVFSRKSSD
jgi:hypothetical protein